MDGIDKPSETQVMLVRESFGQICFGTDLLDSFYEKFLKSSPAIADMFVNTDFEVQKGLLRHGLGLAVFYASDNLVGEKGLRRIRASHGMRGMNISPFLYVFWVESLLEAIGEQGGDGHEDLLDAWCAVLEYTVAFIAGGCDEDDVDEDAVA